MSTQQFLDKINLDILDSLPEGVYIIDKNFKIKYVNKTAERILGIPKSKVLNTLCKNLCKSDRCKLGCPIAEVLETGKNVINLESTFQTKEGKLIPVKLNAAIIRDKENIPAGGIISFSQLTGDEFNRDYLNGEPHFHGIIGKSRKMQDIFKTILEVSKSNASVLITGETGVGKELIANAVVETSRRKNNIFVKVNCSVLPQSLLGSELFGHVRGAFTDAQNDRMGRFEYADGGTIFLDEIVELPFNMQSQLLRVLQEGTFERLGDSVTRKIDVRIIAATNKIISQEIELKRFREDLFYRLNVIPIHVPPLRERMMDILSLTQFFINKFANRYQKNINDISQDALDALMNYDWPGNVRELENSIEYAFIRSKREDSICICCLPPHIRNYKNCNEKLNLNEIEKDEKVETLISLLRKHDWNKSKVADIMGINRSTIYRRLKNVSPD